MKFYDYLYSNNLDHLLIRHTFSSPHFENEDCAYKILMEALENDHSILLHGDYDVDGIMCNLIARDTLSYLGFKNVSVFKYTKRTHKVPIDIATYAIKNNFKVVIIMDTGSEDMKIIDTLSLYGIQVIILDHHKSKFKYEDFPTKAVINTTLEKQEYKLSAGSLVFCFMYKLCLVFNKPALKFISVYALVSLYADCVDMNSELSIGIYTLANSVPLHDFPPSILLLMGQYKKLSRRCIEYTISPVINASFRQELFDLINSFFFDLSLDTFKLNLYKDQMIEVRSKCRDTVESLCDYIRILGVEELKNFILVDLSKVAPVVKSTKGVLELDNYTGLIANNLASSYKKTAIVINSSSYKYSTKGSLRDVCGRNYLDIFHNICEAGGHNAAFGFSLKAFEVESFRDNIRLIDEQFSLEYIANNPIIVDHITPHPDNELIDSMALYNEFSGAGNVPLAFIRTDMCHTIGPLYSKFYHSFKWGGYKIESDTKINSSGNIIIKPIISNSVKLKVQSV